MRAVTFVVHDDIIGLIHRKYVTVCEDGCHDVRFGVLCLCTMHECTLSMSSPFHPPPFHCAFSNSSPNHTMETDSMTARDELMSETELPSAKDELVNENEQEDCPFYWVPEEVR